MKSLVFYGAGQNLDRNFAEWYKNGLVPVCLVDVSVSKQRGIYSTPFGDFDVLSLLQAIERYPDYLLYITLEKSRLAEVTEYLQGVGVQYERIRYCEGFQESASCSFLDSYAINIESLPNGKTIYTYCCSSSHAFRTEFYASGDFLHDYRIVCSFSDKLKTMLNAGYYTRCDYCPAKKVHKKKEQREVLSKRRFIIGSGIIGLDACNFNCSYCGFTQIKRGGFRNASEYESKYDALEVFNAIEGNFDSHNVEITFGASELGISKYRDEILSIWNKNKWVGIISSNSSVFMPGVALLLQQDRIELLTSLDSGTPKTFCKIKGVDFFHIVLSNLEKYADTGGRVSIKYIVLEQINDTQGELDAFLGIVKPLCIGHPNVTIVLSRDYNVNHLCISPRELSALRYLYSKCIEGTIKCTFLSTTFSESDIEAVTCGEN